MVPEGVEFGSEDFWEAFDAKTVEVTNLRQGCTCRRTLCRSSRRVYETRQVLRSVELTGLNGFDGRDLLASVGFAVYQNAVIWKLLAYTCITSCHCFTRGAPFSLALLRQVLRQRLRSATSAGPTSYKTGKTADWRPVRVSASGNVFTCACASQSISVVQDRKHPQYVHTLLTSVNARHIHIHTHTESNPPAN